MAHYTCGVCGQKVKRELLAFREHGRQHIIEAIRKKHPDWTTKDGLCLKCHEYFNKEMGKS